MDLFEAMNTQRAMRRLKPDPVPDELLWRLLDAATRAPNGGNLQPWGFVVVRDPELKRRLQEYYQDGARHVTRPSGLLATNAPAGPEGAPAARPTAGRYLAQHLAEAPALIIGTVRLADVASTTPPEACIFPALQNLLLAARALGLGAVLTTLTRHREKDVAALLGIPEGHAQMALIPIGWPMGRFAPVVRGPTEAVTFWDGWGKTRAR